MNKTTEALKHLEAYRKGYEHGRFVEKMDTALAEPVKQEPVAIGNEWKPCMKLPIVVHVREQREGETHVSTREGITPILPTDLIMRGVAGEEYPIGYELFNKTYTFEIAAPVDAKAIRAEALEEAAKVCEEAMIQMNYSEAPYKQCAAAIRARGSNEQRPRTIGTGCEGGWFRLKQS